MTYTSSGIIGLIVRLFFLLTPFCTLSLFLTFGGDLDPQEQRRFAFRISFAIFCCCAVFYLFGGIIFTFLGITLDAFRIGAGLVLLLNGIDLVRGSGIPQGRSCDGADPGDLAVVPMAIPYTVGPGTIGTLLLMGSNAVGATQRFIELGALVVVCILICLLLFFARRIELVLKRKGLSILGKLTGMFLVALAAQIIFAGVNALLKIR